MFSFSHGECVKPQKGSLQNKMYLNFIFKGCLFLLKDFNQSSELKTIATHRISVLRRLRIDSVIRKLVRKQGINIYTALRRFRKI